MSHTQKPALDTAAAETVLAQLAAKAEKQGQKAKKHAKKAKKIEKAIKLIEKYTDPDESDLVALPVVADLDQARDKFNEKSAKKANNQADYLKAADMVRKAFKLATPTPAEDKPAARRRREVVFAVNAAVGCDIDRKFLQNNLDTVHAVVREHILGQGRLTDAFVERFSAHHWGRDQAARLDNPLNYDIMASGYNDVAGYKMIAAEIARDTAAPARHYILVGAPAYDDARNLIAAMGAAPTTTLDIVVTGDDPSPFVQGVAQLLQDRYPTRVSLQKVSTGDSLRRTLAAITYARLGQRLSTLQPASAKLKGPAQ